jgi:hypothetical protein
MPEMNEILNAQTSDFDAVIDPAMDNLTLDQIKALALKEAAGEQPVIEKKQPEQAHEEPEEHEEEEQEDGDEEVIYRKVIDLGDGAGKQVFEGATPEEVMDKLAEAQAHATRKIREQAAELKKLKEKPAVKEQTQDDRDDELVLSQEMLRNPTTAVKKAFKKATGLDIDEMSSLAETVRTMKAAEAQRSEAEKQNAAAQKFVSENPEYVANQKNGARLNRAVELLVREAQARGEEIDYGTALMNAYNDLRESGLLELKSADATDNADGSTGTSTNRIGSKAGQGIQKQPVRSGSSLTSRARNTTRTQKTLSEDELYNLPLEKLKQLANQQAN